MTIAEIVICVSHKNIDRIYRYDIPTEISDKIRLGMRVIVPFGKGDTVRKGYVVGLDKKNDEEKLKSIIKLIDKEPVFSEELLQLAKWMQEKYYTTLVDCINCIIPSQMALNEANPKKYIILKEYDKQKIKGLTNAQSNVISYLFEKGETEVSLLKTQLKVSDSPIKTLEKKGVIEIKLVKSFKNTVDYNSSKIQPPNPTKEQQMALDFFAAKKNNKPVLIHGVTGSGKTEIYISLVEKALADGKQAIVLVPEIALTGQMVNVFVERFGDCVSLTHSKLTQSERFDQWKKAVAGQISIIIGPRSAVFTPFDNIGIIIIDEEHETTYKSSSSPKYSAKEVALKRAEMNKALLVLGSATPSVQTYYESELGLIEKVTITERINKQYPNVEIVDMRAELEMGNRSILSQKLYEAIKQNLTAKEQTILFLNRRGHSTFVSCRKCGEVMKCDNCNVNYTFHLSDNRLICHYCGKNEDNPKNCPVCGSKYIKYFGVGTQKVENTIRELFPQAKILRMDADTTKGKGSHNKILSQFRANHADILIGTQMIAKGLDFPNVTLVGAVAADVSLNNGDYQAGEHTYQLLTQVSGRAGRGLLSGRVFIQTYNPENYAILFAKDNDYTNFFAHEISLRRQMQYPPFTNIFSVLITGTDEKLIISLLFKLLDIMNKNNGFKLFQTLGPAPAVISKINKQYRWKIVVKGLSETNLKNFVLSSVDEFRRTNKLDAININLTLNPIYLQ